MFIDLPSIVTHKGRYDCRPSLKLACCRAMLKGVADVFADSHVVPPKDFERQRTRFRARGEFLLEALADRLLTILLTRAKSLQNCSWRIFRIRDDPLVALPRHSGRTALHQLQSCRVQTA